MRAPGGALGAVAQTPTSAKRASDCGNGQYCGDPIGSKRSCKALLAEGKLCTKGTQCGSGCCKPHISAGGAPICRPADKC